MLESTVSTGGQECKAIFAPGRSPAVFAAADQPQRLEAALPTGHAAH